MELGLTMCFGGTNLESLNMIKIIKYIFREVELRVVYDEHGDSRFLWSEFSSSISYLV